MLRGKTGVSVADTKDRQKIRQRFQRGVQGVTGSDGMKVYYGGCAELWTKHHLFHIRTHEHGQAVEAVSFSTFQMWSPDRLRSAVDLVAVHSSYLAAPHSAPHCLIKAQALLCRVGFGKEVVGNRTFGRIAKP